MVRENSEGRRSFNANGMSSLNLCFGREEKEIPHMTNSAHYEAKSRRMQLMPRVEMRPSLEPHLMQ